MVDKNQEGYADSTAAEAMRRLGGGRIDYSVFKNYEELREYTRFCNPELKTKAKIDKYIKENMPREGYFQGKIIKWIKKNFPCAVVWKEAAGAYSTQGIPDITCIINGRYYGFEVKRPFIGVLSKIQKETLKKLRNAGAVAEVVSFEKEVSKLLEREREMKC